MKIKKACLNKKAIAQVLFLSVAICSSPNAVDAAHFIVGQVNNSLSGMQANGHTVMLWNPASGQGDNLTDIIGPTGSSGVDNIYMIDCELLNQPCQVGQNLSVKVINNGDGYGSGTVNVTVSGAGYDIAPQLQLTSPSQIRSIFVDDGLVSPPRQIDLIAGSTRKVNCSGTIFDYEGENSLISVSAEFYDNLTSSYGAADDNNGHYTNNTCTIDRSYGNENESAYTCDLSVWYYAANSTWTCRVKATNAQSLTAFRSNHTTINSLLAVSLVDTIDFGILNATQISAEKRINVSNAGNIALNLSLRGYGQFENDGFAMTCTLGQNISLRYTRYNLTKSNPGEISPATFEAQYKNLTSTDRINKFDLKPRQDDAQNEATNATYWRIYVPVGAAGSCQGNIVFGARRGTATP